MYKIPPELYNSYTESGALSDSRIVQGSPIGHSSCPTSVQAPERYLKQYTFRQKVDTASAQRSLKLYRMVHCTQSSRAVQFLYRTRSIPISRIVQGSPIGHSSCPTSVQAPERYLKTAKLLNYLRTASYYEATFLLPFRRSFATTKT